MCQHANYFPRNSVLTTPIGHIVTSAPRGLFVTPNLSYMS